MKRNCDFNLSRMTVWLLGFALVLGLASPVTKAATNGSAAPASLTTSELNRSANRGLLKEIERDRDVLSKLIKNKKLKIEGRGTIKIQQGQSGIEQYKTSGDASVKRIEKVLEKYRLHYDVFTYVAKDLPKGVTLSAQGLLSYGANIPVGRHTIKITLEWSSALLRQKVRSITKTVMLTVTGKELSKVTSDPIASVTVENGKATVQLNAAWQALKRAPRADEFTVQLERRNRSFENLSISNFTYDAAKNRVTFTFNPVLATDREQIVSLMVRYAQFTAHSSSFTIATSNIPTTDPIWFVEAENGSVIVYLNEGWPVSGRYPRSEDFKLQVETEHRKYEDLAYNGFFYDEEKHSVRFTFKPIGESPKGSSKEQIVKITVQYANFTVHHAQFTV